MMLRYRFLFVWFLLVLLNCSLKSVYPLSPRAFSYWYLDKLKTSSLEEFRDKRSLIIFGNWLISCGGWFEDLLICNNKSLGFFYGLYVPLFKLNVRSKKSTILRLVFTSLAKPLSLNGLIIFFAFDLFVGHLHFAIWTVRHLYISHNLFYRLVLLKNTRCKYQQVSLTSAPSKLPIVTSKQLSVCFFFHASLLLNSEDFIASMLHCC